MNKFQATNKRRFAVLSLGFVVLPIALVLAALMAMSCASGPKSAPVTPLTEDKPLDFANLVWSDEFDGETLNRENWDYQTGDGTGYGLPSGWGNNESQYYTDDPKNIKVENGELVITARKQSFRGMKYTSARIWTKNKVDVLYGRIEARIKFPAGNGLWPAFWMLPTDNVYGAWASSGEIDIMEMFGSEPHMAVGTIHMGGAWPNNSYRNGYYRFPDNRSLADDYHVYAVEWDKDVLRWYVDDVMYTSVPSDEWFALNKAGTDVIDKPRVPFDQRFYLLLNFAINGSEKKKVDDSTVLPSEMRVDYVRIYR